MVICLSPDQEHNSLPPPPQNDFHRSKILTANYTEKLVVCFASSLLNQGTSHRWSDQEADKPDSYLLLSIQTCFRFLQTLLLMTFSLKAKRHMQLQMPHFPKTFCRYLALVNQGDPEEHHHCTDARWCQVMKKSGDEVSNIFLVNCIMWPSLCCCLEDRALCRKVWHHRKGFCTPDLASSPSPLSYQG